MSQEKPVSVVHLLSRALHRIRTTPPRIIASPATQPRRAAVALVIRIVPPPSKSSSPASPANSLNPPSDAKSSPIDLTQFFERDWVNDPNAEAEILFLKRDGHSGSSDGVVPGSAGSATSGSGVRTEGRNEAQVAFPGGRMEEGDESALYTAMRQTWEETGLDLADSSFLLIGQLDDREITTSLGKRLLMILSPFVFLYVGRSDDRGSAMEMEPANGTTVYWLPVESLVGPVLPGRGSVWLGAGEARKSGDEEKREARAGKWSSVAVDAASRIAPRHAAVLKVLVRVLVGSMQFPAILLDVPEGQGVKATESSSEVPAPTGKYPALTQDTLEKGGVTATAAAKKTEKEDMGKSGKTKRKERREQLKLWGLSLGMTLDLLAYMLPQRSPAFDQQPPLFLEQTPSQSQIPNSQQIPLQNPYETSFQPSSAQNLPSLSSIRLSLQLPFLPVGGEGMRIDLVAPSLACVFPRFSYPDVNFWIWVFAKRYREVVRGWEASVRAGGLNERRVNWSGTTLNAFYSAVRKALVVVIVLRAIGVLLGLTFAAWWVFT